MRRFWNWVRNDNDTRTLYLEGVIAEQSWFQDDVTPAMFKEELFSGNGPITLHISSPGGDCIAASQIYTMLMEYPGDVTVHIDGLAASAASVIAMAGTRVCMSPTSMMMCHNPFTSAMGDTEEMRKAIQLLDEVKESIINAYQIKTGLSRTKILALREKRAKLWNDTKAFLDSHRGEDGMVSAEDNVTYEKMEADVVALGKEIERLERQKAMDRELDMPTSSMLVSKPASPKVDRKEGRSSDEYKKAFWNQMRGRVTPEVYNALQVGELSEGGYTVPDEFDRQLIEGLDDENIMRGLVHIIRTGSGEHKIPIVASHGTGSWVEEEQQIPESDDAFSQVTLTAHKFATMIRISRELLNDSAFDLAAYIAHEFVRRAGAAEEQAILTGDGSHKPIGLLHATLGAQVGVTTASATAITADELIDMQHSLKSGYRRKACWIMNDATISAIRKLKDGNSQYIWQPGIKEGAPDMLFNQKVLMSNYMPLIATGNKVILYGDYSYYWLAEREGRTLERLNELYAVTDQVGFKMTERLDGRLILPEAVKCLQMK